MSGFKFITSAGRAMRVAIMISLCLAFPSNVIADHCSSEVDGKSMSYLLSRAFRLARTHQNGNIDEAILAKAPVAYDASHSIEARGWHQLPPYLKRCPTRIGAPKMASSWSSSATAAAQFSTEQLEFMERKAKQMGSSPPEPRAMSVSGLSLEQQAFMARKMRQANPVSPTRAASSAVASSICVPDSYFFWEKLKSKGARSKAHWGSPREYTLPLYKHNTVAVGSWACTEGGFDGSANRPTTEIFLVLEGAGFLTDLDGTKHHWRDGDIVVLPKGWSGRWDIHHPIRKIWTVVNHEQALSADESKAVVIGRPEHFVRPRRAEWGESESANKKLVKFGPVTIGTWASTPGGAVGPSNPSKQTEMFIVLEGAGYLTSPDGIVTKFGPGSTGVLPKGWDGKWDIVETMRKVYVVVEE